MNKEDKLVVDGQDAIVGEDNVAKEYKVSSSRTTAGRVKTAQIVTGMSIMYFGEPRSKRLRIADTPVDEEKEEEHHHAPDRSNGDQSVSEEKEQPEHEPCSDIPLGEAIVDADFKIRGGLMSQRRLSPLNDRTLGDVFGEHGMGLWDMTSEQEELWNSQERGYLGQQLKIVRKDIQDGLIKISINTGSGEGGVEGTNAATTTIKKRKTPEKKCCNACRHEMGMNASVCPNCQLSQETADAIMYARADTNTNQTPLATKLQRRRVRNFTAQYIENEEGEVDCKMVEVKSIQSGYNSSDNNQTVADDPPACCVTMQLPPVLVNPSSKQSKLHVLKRIMKVFGLEMDENLSDTSMEHAIKSSNKTQWGAYTSDAGATYENATRHKGDNGLGLPLRHIPGMSHERMSFTKLVFALAKDLGYHMLVKIHGYISPLAQRYCFSGADAHKAKETLLLYFRPVIVRELILTWLRTNPHNPDSLDDLCTFLDGAEARGDHNLTEHAYFARVVMTSYACMTIGERAPYKVTYIILTISSSLFVPHPLSLLTLVGFVRCGATETHVAFATTGSHHLCQICGFDDCTV